MTDRLHRWWDALSPPERIHHHATALCVALFLFHYAWYSAWFVEDAAITFAYARNAALGDGFVTYVGGERVEGFSNPTWTLALAALRMVGIGPWVASKVLGAMAGAATVVIAGRWARTLLPTGRWSALVPLLLAMSPQHVNWCSSGLENAFFGLFMTAGAVALLKEVTDGGRPYSALWFAALAATRPEAPLYVAIAGLLGWAFAFRQGFKPAMRWAVTWGVWLILPLGLWHAWRYSYFAWEFPNTYYAKLGEKSKFEPFAWDKRGWDYLRGWFLLHGRGFLLPLFFIGMTGLKGLRGRAGLALAAITLLLATLGTDWVSWLIMRTSNELPNAEDQTLTGVSRLFAERAEWDEPMWLIQLRVAWIALLAILVPAVTVDRDRDVPRVLAWFLGATVVFFALYSGGDWMRGWRWLSMGIVPISILLACGVHAVVQALPAGKKASWGLGILLTALLLPDAINAVMLVSRPVTTPYDVHRRVQYMQGIRDRLNLDHAVLMDVDMGAHLWWYGPEIVDMAGLVDVSIGHQHYADPFLDDYVYSNRQPTFAHVHGSWASRTGLRRFDGWDDYIEAPPFPVSPYSQHVGNHVHQRHLFEDNDRTGGIARFGRALMLQELDVPIKAVMSGGELYIELGWRRTARSPRGFRAVLFVANDEGMQTIELPPAYDYKPFSRWKKEHTAVGRHRVPVTLPPGRYDLGVAVLGEGDDGDVWRASPVIAGPNTHSPRYADGELRWTHLITVVDADTAVSSYDSMAAQVREHITADHCDEADATWRIERRHLANDHPHRIDGDATLRSELANCFAGLAPDLPRDQAAERLYQARVLDPRSPALLTVGPELAEEWAREAEGITDDAEYIDVMEDVMTADPMRSWDRRRLEQRRTRWVEAQLTEDEE